MENNPKGWVPQLEGPVCERRRFQTELGQLTSASQANTVKLDGKSQSYADFGLLSHVLLSF